jgi:hypothetical protein
MTGRGERGLRQQRYWEHTIRDDRDFAAQMDYTHFNPVKHGLVAQTADRPHSSFHLTPSLQGGRPVNSGQRATCRIRKERRTVPLND